MAGPSKSTAFDKANERFKRCIADKPTKLAVASAGDKRFDCKDPLAMQVYTQNAVLFANKSCKKEIAARDKALANVRRG